LCQNGGLSVLSSIWETGKSRVGGGQQSCWFCQKFPDEKGSVRRCVVVMQQPVLLSPKFASKSSHIAVKCHSSMRNWLFGLPTRSLCEQSPWCQKKTMSMLLTFLFTFLAFFDLGEFGLSVYGSYFIPWTLA
jgi:hypothetical protein